MSIHRPAALMSEANEDLEIVHEELTKKYEKEIRQAAKQAASYEPGAALFSINQKLKIMNQKVQRLVIASDEFP